MIGGGSLTPPIFFALMIESSHIGGARLPRTDFI